MSTVNPDLELNAKRFSGEKYIQVYDQFRPTPPDVILHQSLNYLNKKQAKQLLDLGCGTGISTLAWQSSAEKIIGVEPSEAMLKVARQKVKDNDSITYLQAFANEIPLPNGSIDLVTCSQSFHWMEPESTLAEIDRLLQKHGVLCIYDVEWPPLVNASYETAYRDLFRKVDQITNDLGETIAHKWRKDQHAKNVRKSQVFRYVTEASFHKRQPFDKELLIGIALSQGGLEALLKRGFSTDQIGIDEFVRKVNGMKPLPYQEIIFSYKVIFAVK